MIILTLFLSSHPRFRSYFLSLLSSLRLVLCEPGRLFHRSDSKSSLDIGVVPCTNRRAVAVRCGGGTGGGAAGAAGAGGDTSGGPFSGGSRGRGSRGGRRGVGDGGDGAVGRMDMAHFSGNGGGGQPVKKKGKLYGHVWIQKLSSKTGDNVKVRTVLTGE